MKSISNFIFESENLINPKKGCLHLCGIEIDESKKTIEFTKTSIKNYFNSSSTKIGKIITQFLDQAPSIMNLEYSIFNDLYVLATDNFYNKKGGKYTFKYDMKKYHKDIAIVAESHKYILGSIIEYFVIPLIMINTHGPQKYQGDSYIDTTKNNEREIFLLSLFEHNELTLTVGEKYEYITGMVPRAIFTVAFGLPESGLSWNKLVGANISRKNLPSINKLNIIFDSVDMDASFLCEEEQTFFGCLHALTQGFNTIKELNIQMVQNGSKQSVNNIIPQQIINLGLNNVEKINFNCKDGDIINLTGMLYQYFLYGSGANNHYLEYHQYLTSDTYLNQINISEINFNTGKYIINEIVPGLDLTKTSKKYIPYSSVKKLTLDFNTLSNNTSNPFLLDKGVLPNLKTIIINNVPSDGKVKPFIDKEVANKNQYNIYEICKTIKLLRPDINIKANGVFMKKLDEHMNKK